MIGGAIGLALFILAVLGGMWCVMRALTAFDSSGASAPARAWSDLHIPAWFTLIGIALTVSADPVVRAALTASPAPARIDGAFLWPLMSAPVVAGAVAVALAMIRRSQPQRELSPSLWGAASAAVILLAMAGRVRFFDGQLLMLGAVGIVWWRSTCHPDDPNPHEGHSPLADHPQSPPRQPHPALLYLFAAVACAGAVMASQNPHTAQMAGWIFLVVSTLVLIRIPAAAGWTVLLAATGGIGSAVVLRIGLHTWAETRLAQQTGQGRWLDTLAQSIGSSPYLTGLDTHASAAALLLIVTAAVVCLHGPRPRALVLRRLLGTALLVAAGLTALG